MLWYFDYVYKFQEECILVILSFLSFIFLSLVLYSSWFFIHSIAVQKILHFNALSVERGDGSYDNTSLFNITYAYI